MRKDRMPVDSVIEPVASASKSARSSWVLSWVLSLIPLLALPFMLTVRSMTFVLPNEEPKWAVFLAAALLAALAGLWILTRARLALHLPAIGLWLFFGILGMGVFMAPDRVAGISRYSIWVSCLTIWLTAVYAVQHHPGWIGWFRWTAAVSSLLFSALYFKGYLFDYGIPGYNISVLFSPIGHVNYTSDTLVILLPILATGKSRLLLLVSWIAASVCGSIIIIAASRGAMAGLALGLLLASMLAIRHISATALRANLSGIILVISALIGGWIIQISMPYHFRDMARLSDSLRGLDNAPLAKKWAHLQLRDDLEQPPMASLLAEMGGFLGLRTPLYASSIAMVADSPILGHGTGSFIDVYPKFSNHFPQFRDPASSERSIVSDPHNIILQIASQNGLPAAFIFMGLLVFFMVRLINQFRGAGDWLIWAGTVAVCAALLDSMFNQVFFSPVSMFMFAMFGGVLWGRMGQYRPDSGKEAVLFRLVWPVRMVLALMMIGLMVWPGRWLLSEWYAGHAWRLGYRMPLTQKLYYRQATVYYPRNQLALFRLAQIELAQKKPERAYELILSLLDSHPFHAPSYNFMGILKAQLENPEGAEKAFMRALEILPDYRLARSNLAKFMQTQNPGSGFSRRPDMPPVTTPLLQQGKGSPRPATSQ